MRFPLYLRRWLTGCTLGLMLLAQQSVAAYACPTSLQDLALAAAAMPDCEHRAGTTITALCLKHCESGSNATGQPDIAWTAVAATAPHYFVAQPVIAPSAIDVRHHHLAHAPFPPLIVRLRRFLI